MRHNNFVYHFDDFGKPLNPCDALCFFSVVHSWPEGYLLANGSTSDIIGFID